MKKLRVSVLIPTKNRKDSLKKVLDSLQKQTFKDFEVIIADGHSTDGTLEMISQFSKKMSIRIVDGEGGLVAAMNNAWKKATGVIVTRTDDDIIATPNWLKSVWETFAGDKTIGGVTGPTIIPQENLKTRDVFLAQEMFQSGNLLWRLLGKIYYDFFMEGQHQRVSHWFACGAFSLGSNYKECLKIKKPIEVDNLEACNFSVRRALLAKVGGFDPTFTGVGEYHEPDVAFKIQKLGYKLIFNPKAQIFHCPVQTGIYKARPKAFSRAQNFINFYFRHIKPDTLDKALRFTAYLIFLNLFWGYKFLQTRKIDQLGCFLATPIALIKNIFGKKISS